ncbi:hypothetical protein EKG37_07095 [Robertmurraya yapensis]|uniref:Uncharacterized protein n=2 Tax=Bacillaceae TaxID=186817 RepID=A0A3S0RQI6_9BACI|nr:hypothetical protein [Bacillus yapensis]RTR33971.1 hypothetical protein EKG37_07095 [Bacillus yapensis]TKS97289.1 hypothetical protein FAR12_07095 [Bacillus yapensis]
MIHLLPEQIEKIAEEASKNFDPKVNHLIQRIVESDGSITFPSEELIFKVVIDLLKKHTQVFTLDGLELQNKEAISTFLCVLDNILIADQIKKAHELVKQEFPNSRLKLELRPDPENGEDVLYFLIQSLSDLDKDIESLNSIYDEITLSERFIVNLDFSL